MTSQEREAWVLLRQPGISAERVEAARQELLALYLPLVRLVVGRLALNFPSSIAESGDLIQSGVIGLMDALERFDLAFGVEFRSFAQARIRGSVLDELRSLDWAPRSVRDKARQLSQASAQLASHLQRPPTDDELAQSLGMDLDAYRALVDGARAPSLRSLDALLEEEGDHARLPSQAAMQEERAEHGEMLEHLRNGFELLSERERQVLKLYYDEDLTLKEVANALGVTESRICQIHSASVYKLKGWLLARRKERPPDPAVFAAA